MSPPDIKEIIARLGGPAAIGKVIDRTHSAVCQWTHVPSDHVVALEKYALENGFLVTREDMRPDLYVR